MDEVHLFYVTSTCNTYVTVLTIECFLSNKKHQIKTQKPIKQTKTKNYRQKYLTSISRKKESCQIPDVLVFFPLKFFSCTRLLFILSPLLKENKDNDNKLTTKPGSYFTRFLIHTEFITLLHLFIPESTCL